MSPNIQDGGTETPSRKRTLKDFLESANAQAAKAAALSTKPATPSKLQLVTAVDNLAALEKEKKQEQKGQAEPTSPTDDLMSIDSPLSEMSDGPLSLLTDDAGSSTPARRSTSPNATPCKSSAGASPQVVITIDATPPPGLSATTTASAQPPAAKRKRLTPSEREEKAKADAARKLEKDKAEAARKLEKEKAELAKKQEKEKKEKAEAAKKQERDEQKAVADAKKKAIAEEKEKKRKQKEDEDRRKNEEKEKKRKEKEDEERKVQEAKDKKERSQLRLNSFFKTPSSSSTSTSAAATSGSLLPGGSSPLKPAAARGSSASPRKPTTLATSITRAAGTSSESETVVAEVSEYDRIFKPFFVKENVIVATDLYGMDDETKEAKSRILDEFLAGSRGDFAPPKPFSATAAVDYFHLPCDPTQTPLRQPARGRSRPTVRKIMNMLGPDAIYGGLQSGLDGANEAQTKLALNVLKSVPMKYLFFREDVRPAYYGTVTSQPPTARLSKLARDPLAKTVLPLNYDYDSEAEWVDDGDGEDVDDLDDDEEELDDDGEMSDFLDDSEDAVPLRPAFSGGMEPESTGVCWENERRKAPKPELDNFRMEFILDYDGPIDPFSTHYWGTKEPAPAPDAAAASTSGTPNKSMAPPPAPTDAFAALGAGAAAVGTPSKSDPAASSSSSSSSAAAAPAAANTSSGKAVDPKKAGVAAEFVPDLKKSILQYAKLSKLGIVEMLSVEFVGKCTKGQIKNSLEALAERTGTGYNKTWKLKV